MVNPWLSIAEDIGAVTVIILAIFLPVAVLFLFPVLVGGSVCVIKFVFRDQETGRQTRDQPTQSYSRMDRQAPPGIRLDPAFLMNPKATARAAPGAET